MFVDFPDTLIFYIIHIISSFPTFLLRSPAEEELLLKRTEGKKFDVTFGNKLVAENISCFPLWLMKDTLEGSAFSLLLD